MAPLRHQGCLSIACRGGIPTDRRQRPSCLRARLRDTPASARSPYPSASRYWRPRRPATCMPQRAERTNLHCGQSGRVLTALNMSGPPCSGGMIFTFYKARGLAVGSSLVEEDKLALAKELEEKAKVCVCACVCVVCRGRMRGRGRVDAAGARCARPCVCKCMMRKGPEGLGVCRCMPYVRQGRLGSDQAPPTPGTATRREASRHSVHGAALLADACSTLADQRLTSAATLPQLQALKLTSLFLEKPPKFSVLGPLPCRPRVWSLCCPPTWWWPTSLPPTPPPRWWTSAPSPMAGW